MKYSRHILALSASLSLLCSCTVDYPVLRDGPELSVCCVMERDTAVRGYITGNMLSEIPETALHTPSPSQTCRDIVISAYLHPQSGLEGDYFKGYTFKETPGTGVWHHYEGGVPHPEYWPIGGSLDFLACSMRSGSAVTVSWDAYNASSKATLKVDSTECLHDDIVYAAAAGKSSGSASGVNGGCLSLTFSHSQAWIEIVLTGSVDTDDASSIITLDRIVLEDVYTSGDLVIRNDSGRASAAWDFRTSRADDMELADGLLHLSATPAYIDFLLPEQKRTSLLLLYRLGSNPKQFIKRIELTHGTWLMGNIYRYNINFVANELVVEPSESAWVDGGTVDIDY